MVQKGAGPQPLLACQRKGKIYLPVGPPLTLLLVAQRVAEDRLNVRRRKGGLFELTLPAPARRPGAAQV